MGLVCFTGKLQGSEEDFRQFVDECLGPRRKEYEASRARLGIKKERAFIQDGKVVFTWTRHGPPPEVVPIIFRDLGASTDEFDVWYKGRMKDLLGLDFNANPTPPATQHYKFGPARLPVPVQKHHVKH
jgi:hypothetical protein